MLMTFSNLAAVGADLTPLDVTPVAGDASGTDGLRFLGAFNQCAVGLVRFAGETPWERHQDDELLSVLDGEVLVSVEIDGRVETCQLRAGDLCIVPKTAWHKQKTAGVTLLFVTSQTGNEHRT